MSSERDELKRTDVLDIDMHGSVTSPLPIYTLLLTFMNDPSIATRFARRSWYEFLTSLFAIVGGTFTTLGLIDGILYKAFKSKKL